jgi:carbonic anhydrase/acetyltransferase-like protein (isoleucine patch superfamily)
MELQGAMGHEDTLVPSLRCMPSRNGIFPNVYDCDWVATNAVLIGDVTMKPGSSAWHGVILRGDTAKITIGHNSMIQDNSRLGSNSNSNGTITIGDNVFVGANAILEECELESFSYVGMGASIGKGSVVESFAVIASGAQVP